MSTDNNLPLAGAMPVVPLRSPVLFPGMILHVDAEDAAVKAAAEHAVAHGSNLFITYRRSGDKADIYSGEISKTGCVAQVQEVIKGAGDEPVHIVVRGLYRGERLRMISVSGLGIKAARVRRIADTAGDTDGVNAAASMRLLKEKFAEYAKLAPGFATDMVEEVSRETSPSRLSDFIASYIYLSDDKKEELLNERDPAKRIVSLVFELRREIAVLTTKRQLDEMVENRIAKADREGFLREQLNIIREQLGEMPGDPFDEAGEADGYHEKILASGMPKENAEKLLKECRHLSRMQPGSPDAAVIRSYLDHCLELPWNVFTKDDLDLKHARAVLDRDHYGLDDVKERIIEFLAARAVSPDIKGQIICLAGPPGVGKTSVVKSIASAIGRKYVRISLGGIRDEAEIRGHRRTYVGAVPGRVMSAIKDAGTANPVILLDEVDKLTRDGHGDPSAALLEVLDPEQNNTFTDHYTDLPFDLSRVLFITTANDRYAIPDALRDRMEVIELYSYTLEEKFHIAREHLVKKQLREHGLNGNILRFTDGAIYAMINGYTREAGVRELERMIAKVCRKETVRVAEGDKSRKTFKESDVEAYLGPVKYRGDELDRSGEAGIVNGLAWTSVGGEMLQVETVVVDGTGKLELTGSLGDVMKESARAALTYVRSRSDALGVSGDFSKKDIHIHVPEGAVPKDGPSAGITITASLVSALSGAPADPSVAMTGEVTLRGRVLPIGGLKEKSMAAFKNGISTVIIPKGNVSDLEKIDSAVKDRIRFVPVEKMDDVLPVVIKRRV